MRETAYRFKRLVKGVWIRRQFGPVSEAEAVSRATRLNLDIVRNKGIKPVLTAWVRMENDRAEGRFVFDVTPLVERQ